MSAILERLHISLPAAIATVFVAALLLALYWVLRGRGSGVKVQPRSQIIDVTTLPSMGPVPFGPKLELYSVPMRLAAVVVAPSGRGDPPPDHDIPTILDEIVPGLKQVIEAHNSVCQGWPGQLSAEGFANAFFSSVRLPGDKGKGTPWCELAGKAQSSGQKYLVGMTLRAAQPNAYSLTLVQRESQWLELLRVSP